MAYNPNRPSSGTHRSTPLIARPSSNSHQHPLPPRHGPAGVPQGYLGNMMGGAFAGMGYGTSQSGPYTYPSQPFQPGPAYHPSPQPPQPYPYHQQSNGYHAQGYPLHAPVPSTSNAAYPPLASHPFHSSLPSRPTQSAVPPQNTVSQPGGTNGRASNPAPRPTEFACKLDGCPFVSKSRRTTREHEEDRHLMFEPGREPKPWSGSLKPLEGAVIEGTGISLDTPEAVAKWIEDRKKRWPSKKVVEEKEKAREERIKAGLEEAPRERGAGRGRGRGREGVTVDSHGRGRGRGGYGMGGQARPRESDASYDAAQEPAQKRFKTQATGSGSSSSSSDSGSSESSSDDSDDEGPEAISTVSEEALKALLGDEVDASDDDQEQKGRSEDGDRVEEQSSKPTGDSASVTDDAADATATHKQYQVVCRHWRKGTCALGDAACPYLHTIPQDQPAPPPPRRNRPHPKPTPHNPFSRPFRDAFQLLEEQDVKHVVSDLLQVVDFLKANEWLNGVELRVGQMDEESGIEVLGEAEEERERDNDDAAGDKMDDDATEMIRRVDSTEQVEEDQESVVLVDNVAAAESRLDPAAPARPIDGGAARTAPSGGSFGLVADYASSDEEEDDDEVEEQVKQALLS